MLVFFCFLLVVFQFVRMTVNACHDLSTICIAIVCDRNRRYGFVEVFIPGAFFQHVKELAAKLRDREDYRLGDDKGKETPL